MQTALFTMVKNRNPSYVASAEVGADLIKEILFHRSLEIWGKGFRFRDLERMNAALNTNGISNYLAGIIGVRDIPDRYARWQWVYPQPKLNANKFIVQKL
ncbi:MAG: hypothetical protein ABIX01_08305 [Chitinophagaceae bacterium]